MVADGQGIPLACLTASASPAEVTLAEEVVDQVAVGEKPTPLIADKAYDSDPLRSRLLAKGWDLVCPHRAGRKRKATQDGRKLRRYRRRWKIERSTPGYKLSPTGPRYDATATSTNLLSTRLLLIC